MKIRSTQKIATILAIILGATFSAATSTASEAEQSISEDELIAAGLTEAEIEKFSDYLQYELDYQGTVETTPLVNNGNTADISILGSTP